jgi:hypothetical protein
MGLLVFKSNDFFRVINYNTGRKMAAAGNQLVAATTISVVSEFDFYVRVSAGSGDSQ